MNEYLFVVRVEWPADEKARAFGWLKTVINAGIVATGNERYCDVESNEKDEITIPSRNEAKTPVFGGHHGNR